MMKKYFLAVFLMALTGGMMTSCVDDDTSKYDGYKIVTDDDDDNGGNNQGGQGSSDINGTYMMYSFADETYQGADVIYVVVVMDGYISFVRDIDFEGEDNDQQVTFVGTYSYQNGQYVAMMHEESDTTDYRFTFTVNDDEMSFTYSGRTIVLSKDEVDK
jgi:hypothetical protein